MFRSVANKNGTIEVNGNAFRFSQPADEYKTEDTTRIEESYTSKMDYIADDPHYITARDIESRNGQITLEFDLTELKMFDYIRTLFLAEKIYYYQSLLEIAKRDEAKQVNVLWKKENFAADPQEKAMKCMIIEHEAFQLYEQKDTVQSLKELIILSLTSLNRVLGKPRRADFLEQNEDVIHFAEKIYLKAKTISEIEEYINTEMYRLEMRQKEEESTQKQGKLAELRKKLESKTPANQKKRETIISKLKNGSPSDSENAKKEKDNNSKNDKKWIVWCFGAVAAAVVLSVALTNVNDNENTSVSTENEEKAKIQQTEHMVSVYRDSFFEEPESTISKMEEIGYKNLSEHDKDVLNHLYIETESYQKAMQNDASKAGDIARAMYQKEEYEALEGFVNGLDEENLEASFYLAHANENWDQVLELKEDINLDHEQANIVITAYFSKENVPGAEEFLETVEQPTENMQERVNKAKEAQED